MLRLTPREEKIVFALAAAAIPPGNFLPAGGAITVERLRAWLAGAPSLQLRGIRSLLWMAEASSTLSTGRPFSKLPTDRARRFLEEWQASRSHLRRTLLRTILTPIKAAHFDDPKLFAHVGCGHRGDEKKVRVDEAARWMEQVVNGKTTDEDLSLECEVVVVGTGAGGAACAYELASRGRAVLLIEEGEYHRRSSFTAHATDMSRKLYRNHGLTIALGNVGIPVWAGRAVGGSTVINSGTCYRTSERIFRRWREEHGLTWFSSSSMDPYYRRVESMLQVTQAKRELTGGIGRVVSRGADALGLKNQPLMRNAPDCDGQGVCCFGCPTGAKRSTDVSYVPEALKRGAQLVTSAKVEAIDVISGRARGVRGRLGSGRTFTVKAECVVIAGGALLTPVLLKRAGVCKNSAFLGRNLSIHPAAKVMATFDETIDMAKAIPQGHTIDHFAEEGILFEGASMPVDVTAISVPWVGQRFTDLMEGYRNMATFGFMIEDTSRGAVRPGRGDMPLVTYNMNDVDLQKMGTGLATLCEVFFAAGAKRVAPMVAGLEEISSVRDLARLRGGRLRPGDFEVTAFHPLGTCRIGTDPKTSVLGPDHEAHEVERLYVTDGSAMPSALGVNPQMTIMAMALRAAEIIDQRI